MNSHDIRKRLREISDRKKAKVLQRFFKTGPGQYGEGDVFLGITVPVLRKLAKECRETSIKESVQLLRSEIHEERLLALFLFISTYNNGDEFAKKKIYSAYLKNARFINNWDLVDLSAPKIVGNYLDDKSRHPLYGLARSPDLWQRRIAIVSTFHFISKNNFHDTLNIARLLLNDDHDLIHKAVGWMLREVGKRDRQVEERFLSKHCRTMPRTMLRYAIERFPEALRKGYMNGTF